jgi:L-fucose isomerase-like protein
MVQASGRPSALLDWNNNYADDGDKCVLFHCSNLPQDLFGKKGVMDYQEIIAGSVGKENTYGTVVGRVRPTEFTYCRVSTDDQRGVLRAYLGEGEFTRDPLETFGGYVAINPSRIATVVEEAMTRYLGWEVYNHDRSAARPAPARKGS